MDLSTLSKDELLTLQKDVASALKSFEDRKKKEALAAAEAVAREHGFALAELTGKKASASRNPAKYANPADKSQTWTGRGRKPGWVLTLEADGKDLAGCAI